MTTDFRRSRAVSRQQPHEIIWTLTNAVVASRCLHVVAELGVADDVGDTPVSAVELASRCGADADALERALRLLAAHGVFERESGGFRHTPASQLLRSDHPMSMRALSRMMGLPVFSTTFANLEHSLRTGSPALETVEPRGLWAYNQDHPDEALIFGQAMTAKAAADIAAVLDAYDFSRFRTIADIGGGRGHLLRAVLDAVPDVQGVLFDLPKVAILSAIRRAAAPAASVLVIENVLPDKEADPRGQTLDVIMLAVTGGRERTVSQLSELFNRAGFTDGAVVETAGPLRIVEATTV